MVTNRKLSNKIKAILLKDFNDHGQVAVGFTFSELISFIVNNDLLYEQYLKWESHGFDSKYKLKYHFDEKPAYIELVEWYLPST